MFLDEELEQILNDNKSTPIGEISKKLVKACINRFADPMKEGQQTWLNSVKRTESSWRLFAKKHPEVKVEGFRDILKEAFMDNDKDAGKKVIKALGWEK